MRRALFFTTSERYLGLIANFATIAVVSRILTPSQIGVSVLAMAIISFALAAREFATTNFIVQREFLQPEDIRTAFTVLMLISLAISAALVAYAEFIPIDYKEEGLVPYFRVGAVCLLIDVVSAPITALMRRQMKFKILAIINVSGTVVNAATTIFLAFAGFSYMSFVWAWLASVSTVTFLSLAISTDRSIFRPCLVGWRPMVTFGGLNGTNILLYRLYDSLPYVVLARTLSLDAVALYNRGITVCQLPDKFLLGGVGSVLLSAFSLEVRRGGNLRVPYLRAIELITALQWPALVGLAILADPVVNLVLGEQWIGAVPLVRIMALASLFSFSAELNYPVLVAMGAMRDVLIRSLIAWPASALIITCASLFGLQAAALAWLVTMPFQAYVSVCAVRKHLAISWLDIASSLWRGAIVTLLSALGPLAVVLVIAGRVDLPAHATVAAVALSAFGWSVGLLLTAHPLLREIELVVSALLPKVALGFPFWRLRKGKQAG